MRLALDAMGGDNVPLINIEGAIAAAKKSDHQIILVGKEDVLRQELNKLKVKNLSIDIVNATEVIDMHEPPGQAVRQKKDSSIAVAGKLVVDGKADAFVSAGNSGAIMATAMLTFGRIRGVNRPAIATLFPTFEGKCMLLDVGANVDCKPINLLEFAIMGSIYMNEVIGIEKPRVGLVSIGEEDCKGNEQTLAALELLKDAKINFIGNIEGKDITRGNTDVVVCDGFVGNILLKFGEGVAEMMIKLVKSGFKAHPLAWASLPFLWAVLKDFRKKVDYTEYGGAPLLGVNGSCIICHGSSNAKTIKNALFAAAKFSEKNVNREIAEEMAKIN